MSSGQAARDAHAPDGAGHAPDVIAGYRRTEVGVIPDDWDCCTLCTAVVRFVNGGTPSTKNAPFWSGDIPWITGADILSQKVAVIRRYITEEAIHNSAANVIAKGNLLIVSRTGVGKLAIAPCDIAISQDFTGVIPSRDKLLAKYLFRYLDLCQHVLAKQNQGTSIKGVTRDTLAAILIPLPPLPEQHAIAAVLSDIDDLIGPLEALITKKRAIKQAAMQQLLTGRTRLPGFGGEWETRRLGDHLTFLRHGAIPRSGLTSDGTVKYLHYGDIHKAADVYLNPNLRPMPTLAADRARSLGRLYDGDLVFVDASEDIEGVGKSVEVKGLQGQQLVSGLHTIAARFRKCVLADGFKAYLQFCPAFRHHLRRLAAGTKVYATNRAHIASAELPLPPLPEQQAIATVLSDMDAEIAALEHRLDKTRAIKQGMMQQLLTGSIRLPIPDADTEDDHAHDA